MNLESGGVSLCLGGGRCWLRFSGDIEATDSILQSPKTFDLLSDFHVWGDLVWILPRVQKLLDTDGELGVGVHCLDFRDVVDDEDFVVVEERLAHANSLVKRDVFSCFRDVQVLQLS